MLVVLPIEQFGLKVLVLGPIQIHAQEHFGPIVGIGSAVAGVDRQQGRVGVVRAVQQGLGFQRFQDCFHAVKFAGDFGRQAFVFLGHFHKRGKIAGRLDQLLHGFQHGFKGLELGDGLLGLFLIVPEIGRGKLLFDGSDFRLFAVEVKESLAIAKCDA